MKLIPNANKAHRMWSVQLAIAAGTFAAMEGLLPSWQGLLPDGVFLTLSFIAALGSAATRVIKQQTLDD